MGGEIRHLCLFRLGRSLTEADRSGLERFAAKILESLDGVRTYRFVANRSLKGAGFDLVLDSSFASEAALTAYREAPLHDALAGFMAGFVEQTIVADF